MWASEVSKTPILEFNLEKVLACLEMTQEQFIDVCILAGCDYCDTIKGARPGRRRGREPRRRHARARTHA